ncbi:MAG: hypothetical protein RIS35_2123 [Pseudomonadota bacterium]|jgi:adenylyltransferase/sulfurtransferase
MNDDQLLRFSRHILLDDVGIEGQQRLLDATALIVGAGGLGCPAALYLAASGVGRLLIADDDTVDLTNLQRQVLHRERSLGQPKVLSARDALGELHSGTAVEALRTRLEDAALREAVRRADVVLDCSDGFATRHEVNRACVEAGVPLVSGAAIRFDGQVAVFDPRDPASACYHCVFPASERIEEVRCATMGVFSALTGIVGTLQAAEAMKLLGGFGEPLVSTLLMIDARTMHFDRIRLPRNPDCPVCAERG